MIRTAAEGDNIHISIADTGSGIPDSIPKQDIRSIFHDQRSGARHGTGLAIARSVIVERHKGSLTFESTVGKGTTFHIRLPLSRETAEKV